MSEQVCLAGRQCRDYNHEHQHAAYTWHRPLCLACIRHGERAVGQLVYDYRDLEQHLPPSLGQRLDGQPGHNSDAPIPIRVDVEALQRAIWWVTTTWAEILSERDQLTALSKRTRHGWATQWACGIIGPRVDVLVQIGPQELADYPMLDMDEAIRHRQIAVATITGAQAVLDMTWLHERARSILGLTKLVRQLPGYCQQPRCGRPSLQQENGSDTVGCGYCGHTQTRDEYERYGNVFLQGAA